MVKEAKNGTLKKKSKILDLPVGIHAFVEAYQKRDANPTLDVSNYSAFQAITQPDASNEKRYPVVCLLAGILSSYLIREIFEMRDSLEFYPMDEPDVRALYITVSEQENFSYILKQIACSVIIDTAVHEDESLKLETPSVIPTNQEGCIMNAAYLKVRGFKKHKWPAPYRDTSVLLDQRFISKDIKEFSKINPWCTCVIYGGKVKLPFGFHIDLKGAPLADMELNWDSQKVHDLVEVFVASVPSLFQNHSSSQNDNTCGMQCVWMKAGEYLSRYRAKSTNRLNDSEKFKLRLLTSSLLAFLMFAGWKCGVPQGKIEAFRDELLNILRACLVFTKEE